MNKMIEKTGDRVILERTLSYLARLRMSVNIEENVQNNEMTGGQSLRTESMRGRFSM